MHLISTCVGGRRSGITQPIIPPTPRWQVLPEVIHKPTARQIETIETVIRAGDLVRAAEEMGISIKTMECHMSELRARYEVRTTYQLIAKYVEAKTREQVQKELATAPDGATIDAR
jgi:DNA-binding NarL/FixJ family response regulator